MLYRCRVEPGVRPSLTHWHLGVSCLCVCITVYTRVTPVEKPVLTNLVSTCGVDYQHTLQLVPLVLPPSLLELAAVVVLLAVCVKLLRHDFFFS